MESCRYNYVVTALKSSRVDRSCVGHFTDRKDVNLITSKCNRLEIFKLNDEVLEPLLDVEINGDVVLLELFCPLDERDTDNEARDLLFMATRRYCYVFEWNIEEASLMRRSDINLTLLNQPFDQPERTQNPIGIIDKKSRVIGLHVHAARFEVIPFDTQGQLWRSRYISLEKSGMVLDIKFLFGCPKPTIAVLYEDRGWYITTHDIAVGDLNNRVNLLLCGLPDVPKLILPIPAPLCGFVVFGKHAVAYYSASTDKTTSDDKYPTIESYDVIHDGRYLAVDEDGLLHLLTIDNQKNNYTGLKHEVLGKTSACVASTISVLSPQIAYVGSRYGDSKLLKMKFRMDQNIMKTNLNFQHDAEGSYVEVVESYVNIGPIRDFCVLDLERLGQGTVITLSGSIEEGSLRIIRHGFIMNEMASVKEGGITGLWSVRPGSYETFLVVSCTSETKILAMNKENVLKETKIEGLCYELETLFCHDAGYDQLVQVTSNSVRLVSLTAKKLRHEFSFPSDNPITVATANMTKVLCAGVRSLVYMEIGDGRLNVIKHADFQYEVSCLDIGPISENPAYNKLAAIGFWNDKSVGILSLPDFKLLCREHLERDAVVRAISLCAFEGIYYLLCGLGDGNLLTFSLDLEKGKLTERKRVSLGLFPVTLHRFLWKNTTHVFAACDSPTVIYSINKKLLYSRLNLQEVSYVCSVNFADIPNSLALADTDGLRIGIIDYQMPHIRTISVQDSVHCICYQDYSQTLALCSAKYRNSSIEGRGTIHLICGRTFEFMSEHSLENLETGLSIVSCSFSDDDTVYYCVGTAFPTDEEESFSSTESDSDSEVERKGRILVFVVKNRKLELIAQKDTKGAVQSLIAFNGKLLASLTRVIQLYKWIHHDDGTFGLELECWTWRWLQNFYRPWKWCCTRGNIIVVGSDSTRELCVLMYKPETGAIELIATHRANWVTAVEILDDGNTYLLADKRCNFVTIEIDSEGAIKINNVVDFKELPVCRPVGSYHVGFAVNQFKHGSLVMQTPDSSLSQIPTCIFGTANGAIGMVASLPHDQFIFLKDLQKKLRKFLKARSDLPLEEKTHDIHMEQESNLLLQYMEGIRGKNFIDGNLIESFLHLSLSQKEEVSSGVSVPVEELIERVEELTKLHWGCY